MLYAILYALGAICFWMWEYEDGEVGWRRWVTPLFWPVFVLFRIASLIGYSLGNVLIERRLKAEEKAFWEEQEHWDATVGDFEWTNEGSGGPSAFTDLDGEDTLTIGTASVSYNGPEEVEPVDDDHVIWFPVRGTEQIGSSLDDLRERALGPNGPLDYEEDDDGMITLDDEA